jgi:hypothetical protein
MIQSHFRHNNDKVRSRSEKPLECQEKGRIRRGVDGRLQILKDFFIY